MAGSLQSLQGGMGSVRGPAMGAFRGAAASLGATTPWLKLVVEVFEVFLEFLVRKDFLELAPGRLAALALVADALVHAVEQAVVIGAVFRLADQEFIVEVEALVISFRH